MVKHNAFKSILNVLEIPVIDLYLSKGSTVTRAGLREVYRALNPNDNRILYKHNVTKAILEYLGLEIRPDHFSTGSTVTKVVIEDILEALVGKEPHSMAA
jgi:hypothetical protein